MKAHKTVSWENIIGGNESDIVIWLISTHLSILFIGLQTTINLSWIKFVCLVVLFVCSVLCYPFEFPPYKCFLTPFVTMFSTFSQRFIPFNYRDFLFFDKICSRSSAAELLYWGKGLYMPVLTFFSVIIIAAFPG